MTENIITISNLGKKYDITHHRGGYIALRDIITNAFQHPLEFITKKAKSMIGKDTKEEFWALKDVNIEIKAGEAVGIIGANGAGKSTLLKILSKITPPTTGEIVLHGRVSSLLEVGTGFHPELTGRENIFLNAAILGMTRKEMAKKFDDTVAFSGVEKFLDTPVKYYSSGMYVRLAFSVAAHMEPDILIIDEVLAVGDADFQKKCLGKMDEVTKTAGRTVLFVSHNMSAVQSLCKKVILLENGQVKMVGEATKVIANYLKANPLSQTESSLKTRKDRRGRGNVKITSFFVEDDTGKRVSSLSTGGRYTFCFDYESTGNKEIKDLSLAIAFSSENGSPLVLNWSKYTKQDFSEAPAKGTIRCRIPQKFPLADGMYGVAANLFSDGTQEDFIKNLGVFEVSEGDFYGTGVQIKHSPIMLDQEWSVQAK